MATTMAARTARQAVQQAEPKGNVSVNLPDKLQWTETVMVRTGGFASAPPPDWALEAVENSYKRYSAGDQYAALSTTLDSPAQAKAVLHQLRRAAKQLGYGLGANVVDSTLTFQAKQRKALPAVRGVAVRP
jgi:CHAD domain-containing protein